MSAAVDAPTAGSAPLRWIQSETDVADDPKTLRLMELLDLELHAAIGLLHLLWHWVGRQRPDGDLAGVSAFAIARGARWAGDPDALVAVLACKAAAGDAAVRITNEAMTLVGGIGYRENSTLARLLRDARASHVMSPTTDILKTWVGKALLNQPLI